MFSVCHWFLRRPSRMVPRFYVKPRLIFCVSSVLDPIGDRNDVYIGHPLIGDPPYRAGAAWPMPRTGPGRPAHAPPPVRGPWGLRPRGQGAVRRGPLREGPAHGAGHGPSGPARSGAWARPPGPVWGMGQAYQYICIYQTSFRSPIGSRTELTQKISRGFT